MLWVRLPERNQEVPCLSGQRICAGTFAYGFFCPSVASRITQASEKPNRYFEMGFCGELWQGIWAIQCPEASVHTLCQMLKCRTKGVRKSKNHRVAAWLRWAEPSGPIRPQPCPNRATLSRYPGPWPGGVWRPPRRLHSLSEQPERH